MLTIDTHTVRGRQVIEYDALVRCNIRYHKPYLARLDEQGRFEWQTIVLVGYGKSKTPFYVIEGLKTGDYIQCAGGSGGNTYPFKAKVEDRTDKTLVLTELTNIEWSNVKAELQKAHAERTAAALGASAPTNGRQPTLNEEHEFKNLQYLAYQAEKLALTLRTPGRLPKKAISNLVFDIEFTAGLAASLRHAALKGER